MSRRAPLGRRAGLLTAARMPAHSYGTLLYRHGPAGLEVLIVHPSGAYNRNAPWGIPKGLAEPGEDPEVAARRETLEETGVESPVALVPLGEVRYRNGKRVHAFAGLAPAGALPRTASWEIDSAEFVPLAVAREKLHLAQSEFLDRLEKLLRV